ncbi:AAA family ATPase [Methanocaldococcus fervens]|uniref:Cobyrinic acid ac-diamide synthase n=1 Tax=Methanocaldococcus fervens (strain DSM 4213 / JCM 15782 / AG86) TaxID=573064 RepID=C7P6L1_METFA|nr:AAA family ATPase [Methanocaldococcus fervens]ACV24193.1 Cobyrinic acid ac-diamide synthase [Methanocaldococcus fervens AG86]
MEIGILDIIGSLPLFEDFGNLPTKIIDEKNYKEIKNLDALIIPGGSLVESKSLNDDIKKEIINFDGYIIGICSGFQILSKKIDIGRKSSVPIFREGLNLLDVEFYPLVCTDRVEFKLKKSIFGEGIGRGFHCHTYGDVRIVDKETKILTVSKVKKLNYKLGGEKEIISGAFKGKVFGTMVHNFLDNEFVRENFLNHLGVKKDEKEEIFEKNKIIKEELKRRALKYRLNPELTKNEIKKDNKKRGIVLLATSSNSGKTFLTTALSAKLNGRVFVAKIGGDVRDIVPALYLLREKMTKYNSIKIGERGWVDVSEFLDYVKNSNYDYIIVEGVMGAFTAALKNLSSYQIAKKLGFPVYVVSPCNISGIEGAFVEAVAYYSLLKDIGIKVEGIILNKVYDWKIFDKLKSLAKKHNIKLYGVGKVADEGRGLIPEVEIDYESFCRNAFNVDLNIDIPEIEINNNINDEDYNFIERLDSWIRNIMLKNK